MTSPTITLSPLVLVFRVIRHVGFSFSNNTKEPIFVFSAFELLQKPFLPHSHLTLPFHWDIRAIIATIFAIRPSRI